MKNVKKLFYTTIALTLTSFLMKTVGVWFNVYLSGLIGSTGIGIFQLVLSVYAMAKTLSYGGMNLTATRMCIDDYKNRRSNMRKVLFTALSIGTLGAILLYVCSDVIAAFWIMTESASVPLKILSVSLPFISLSSALNGYMTAIRKMGRYSVIQLLEQIVKILLTFLFIERSIRQTTELSVSLVCLAITCSEIFSFSLALFFYMHDGRKTEISIPSYSFFKKMLRLALPDALGSYIRSGLNTLEHLLIPRGIKKNGASADRAFSDYGIVQGMALPILLYPSSILGVISGLLVPEIAECKMKRNHIQANYIINRVLQVAIVFSIGTMAAMIVYADELSFAIYDNCESSKFIRLIAPLIPIMYMDMSTDGMLKGLDLQLETMKINIIDSVLCVVLVWILVPKMAVEGYILTIYFAEIINFCLSFMKLGKASKLRLSPWKNVFVPIFCSFAAMKLSKKLLFLLKKPTPGLILSIGVGVILYYFFLRIGKGISKEDSMWLKNVIKP